TGAMWRCGPGRARGRLGTRHGRRQCRARGRGKRPHRPRHRARAAHLGQPLGLARMRSWTRSAAETEAQGARFARARPRNADLFAAIYLTGDLGAGKTTWTRGFLASCGVTAVVRSPTYTLLELYDLGDVHALHLDLYRLQDESELETLGLRDW